ncbi:DUF296 domain-containing protein [Mesorhizobium sp. dw_380]|uniref:PPC domain-containing DNA-binding protein n=1 Tax=Mesorhizobium sp. dw_380 TaxID=2812001 RepID=UPI001BDE031A|nr:DUF296 domain-containing protein [Mesorhizobium sp. dw_380]
MKSQLVNEIGGQRTLGLDPGEEAFAALTAFAVDQKVGNASRKIPIDEQCEVLSAIGDVALDDDGKPSLHVHAVLGLSDSSTRGGHLLEGIVRPTLEVTLVEAPGHLRRSKRPVSHLIDLDA